MHWIVAAPFDGDWLTSYVPGKRHSFAYAPPHYQHDRSRKSTSAGGWREYCTHASQAMKMAREHGRPPAGVITVFPQLALLAALRKRYSWVKPPILAWCFNVGHLPSGMRQRIARHGLGQVDRFVVHSSSEIDAYAPWAGLPPARFQFVPLQRAALPLRLEEDRERPFLLSMGAAQRDYRSFFAAVEGLGYRTIVVAPPHAVAGLKMPANVEMRENLTIDECHALVQQARVNVVPVANDTTASGQVTLIDAMMFGRAAVATRCVGTVDYVRQGETAFLVEPQQPEAIRKAIQQLWEDEPLRLRVGTAARRYVEVELSDTAAGASLGKILDELEDSVLRKG